MRHFAATAALLAVAAIAWAAGQVTVQYVDFPKDAQARTYTRSVKGEDLTDYLIRKVEDQEKFDITISSSNDVVFFDVYDPKGTNPRFTGWRDGEHFAGRFDAGTVKIRVYQRYDIAARNESATYSMTITPQGVPPR